MGLMNSNNPYNGSIENARNVMKTLVGLMIEVNDMKLFRNIAAVYIVWQYEVNNLENAALNWEKK